MSHPEDSPSAARLVTAYRAEWASLVELAVMCRTGGALNVDNLAAAAKKNPGAVAAKLNAIMGALAEGMKAEDIIERGERDILSGRAQKRGPAADGTVMMSFRVTPEVKQMVVANLDKVQGAMGYGTREEFWDWLNALLVNATDDEIRHAVGEAK